MKTAVLMAKLNFLSVNGYYLKYGNKLDLINLGAFLSCFDISKPINFNIW